MQGSTRFFGQSTRLRKCCLWLAAAHKIYGRDLTRIPSIGWFADTVGKLIQGRIQSMD